MKPDIFLFSFYISLVFTATILYLIRKQKLKEQYSLLWLLLSALMMFLSLFPSILDDFARLIHISYAPSLLYLLSVIGILFILLHLTMAVSSLTQRKVVLVQTVALQDRKIRELTKRLEMIEQQVSMEQHVYIEQQELMKENLRKAMDEEMESEERRTEAYEKETQRNEVNQADQTAPTVEVTS